MIVRILGEGQYQIHDDVAAQLDQLDDKLDAAVDAKDDAAFKSALSQSVELVRANGDPLPHDAIATADLILPSSDADIAEVLHLLESGELPD